MSLSPLKLGPDATVLLMRLLPTALLGTLLLASQASYAANITLDSAVNGVYTYGFHTGAGPGGSTHVAFFPGQGFGLTGLSGVTNVDYGPLAFDLVALDSFAQVYTPTSVEFIESQAGGVEFIGDFPQLFVVDSTVLTTGPVTFTITGTPTGDLTTTGEVLGPVTAPSTSVTPEPSSIALFGTDLLGIAGVVRKRFA